MSLISGRQAIVALFALALFALALFALTCLADHVRARCEINFPLVGAKHGRRVDPL